MFRTIRSLFDRLKEQRNFCNTVSDIYCEPKHEACFISNLSCPNCITFLFNTARARVLRTSYVTELERCAGRKYYCYRPYVHVIHISEGESGVFAFPN